MKLLTVVHNDAGVRFNVILVKKGERYGRCAEDGVPVLVHKDEDPMVEFYDTRRFPDMDGGRGNFVSRYFVSTLLESKWGSSGRAGLEAHGLDLNCGIADWKVNGENMREVFRALMAIGAIQK